ncbi:MAG: thioredoxin domain-containing protein [Magnetococcales bacterium]|nr:thioredoxin domain-containing protein [Magnetococcales bacterium]
MNRKLLFGSVAGALLLGFVAAVMWYQNQRSEARNTLAEAAQSALYRAGAPIKGSLEAKVTIVEFLDPACETCREFYPLVSRLLDLYPGKVRLMVRYAPLHSGSDQVVRMLEAAHRQGKFWQALERLFGNQERWVVNHSAQPQRALAALSTLGLNQQQFSSDRDSPEVAQVVQQDIRDGQTLAVRATPEFFVNGHPLPSFGYEQLSILVKEAVNTAYGVQ